MSDVIGLHDREGDVLVAVPKENGYTGCRRASDQILRLVCGLSEPTRGNRLLLMLTDLTAFIDDSDMTGEGPVAILAGWVAPAKVWAEFVDDWQNEVLTRHGPPIAVFKPNIWSLTSDSEKARLKAALGLLEKHKLFGVLTVLPHSLYSESDHPFVHQRLRKPYFWALYGIVLLAAQHYSKLDVRGPIDFIFDHQPGQEALISETWHLLIPYASSEQQALLKKSPPKFEDDESVLGLQAAHLLAWNSRRVANDVWQRKAPYTFPWPASIQVASLLWTPELIERTSASLNKRREGGPREREG